MFNTPEYVVLKSGGPVMEVTGYTGGDPICEWTDGTGKHRRQAIPRAHLNDWDGDLKKESKQ